jgi:hypothetical protein
MLLISLAGRKKFNAEAQRCRGAKKILNNLFSFFLCVSLRLRASAFILFEPENI